MDLENIEIKNVKNVSFNAAVLLTLLLMVSDRKGLMRAKTMSKR